MTEPTSIFIKSIKCWQKLSSTGLLHLQGSHHDRLMASNVLSFNSNLCMSAGQDLDPYIAACQSILKKVLLQLLRLDKSALDPGALVSIHLAQLISNLGAVVVAACLLVTIPDEGLLPCLWITCNENPWPS